MWFYIGFAIFAISLISFLFKSYAQYSYICSLPATFSYIFILSHTIIHWGDIYSGVKIKILIVFAIFWIIDFFVWYGICAQRYENALSYKNRSDLMSGVAKGFINWGISKLTGQPFGTQECYEMQNSDVSLFIKRKVEESIRSKVAEFYPDNNGLGCILNTIYTISALVCVFVLHIKY